MPTSDGTAAGIKQALGKRVRELRERSGMSQGDLAHASGVSKVFLGTVELAKKAPTIETIAKLALGLGVEPVELFRFGAAGARLDPAGRLGQKVAAFAQGATEGRIQRFERISRLYFQDDKPKRAPKSPRRS